MYICVNPIGSKIFRDHGINLLFIHTQCVHHLLLTGFNSTREPRQAPRLGLSISLTATAPHSPPNGTGSLVPLIITENTEDHNVHVGTKSTQFLLS